MHNACSFGHAEVVQLLLKHGADANSRDNWNYTPLHEAAIKGKIDVCIGECIQNLSCYRLPTKLREVNVFTGVCLFTGGRVSLGLSGGTVSLVPGHFRGLGYIGGWYQEVGYTIQEWRPLRRSIPIVLESF